MAPGLQADSANLVGDDFGVEVPIGRYRLTAELDRQVGELHDAVFAHWEACTALASAIFTITSRYSSLDEELAGDGAP